MSESNPYKVGYAKPPLEHRFQKGFSGNKRGRPKGSKSISAVISAAFSERVTIMQNGERRTISKLEAACAQLVNKSASGDRHAAKLMIELLIQAQLREEARANNEEMSPADRQAQDKVILAAIRAQSLAVLLEPSDDDES